MCFYADFKKNHQSKRNLFSNLIIYTIIIIVYRALTPVFPVFMGEQNRIKFVLITGRDFLMEVAMFKKYLFVILAVLLAACTGTPAPNSTPSAQQINTEEQAVYAALLQNMYSAAWYVIMDTTATSPVGVGDTASTLDRIVQDLPSIDQETVDSFRSRNDAAYPVLPTMELGSGYALLSQAEMSQIFSQNRDGWQVFYEQYPDAPGITSLSRVGFNMSLDQALVYVGTISHYLAGSGYFVLLNKVNGLWIVDQQVMTWIS
jgi:hypothetical protein